MLTRAASFPPVSTPGVRRPHQGAERLPGAAAGEGGGDLGAQSREEQHQGEDDSSIPVPFSSQPGSAAYLSSGGNGTSQIDETPSSSRFACRKLGAAHFTLRQRLEKLIPVPSDTSITFALRCPPAPTMPWASFISVQFGSEDHDPIPLASLRPRPRPPSGWDIQGQVLINGDWSRPRCRSISSGHKQIYSPFFLHSWL